MDIDTEIELEIRIEEAIVKILAELEAGKEATVPPESLDGTIGRLSRQDALMQQEMAKDAQRRRALKHRLLQEATDRIARGTYGICVNCDEEIATARLLEIPETPFCSGCA